MKNLIVASTSTIYGGNFLEYLIPELREHFKSIKPCCLFLMQDQAASVMSHIRVM